MGDDNPLRGAYLTCSNEIRWLVIYASTELNQDNTFIAAFFKILIRTVQRILNKFHLTEETDKFPRGGKKPFNHSLKRIQSIAVAADTPANEALRLDFARWYIRITLAGRKIIFIDEVGMRVHQGRSPIGIRAQNRVPAIRTRNMNLMAAWYWYNTSLMTWLLPEIDYKFQ